MNSEWSSFNWSAAPSGKRQSDLLGNGAPSKRVALDDISNRSRTSMSPYGGSTRKMDIANSPMPMAIQEEEEEVGNMLALDQADLADAQTVAEYVGDIYDYLFQIQRKYKPPADYLKVQPDINETMISILNEWLVEVAEEYHLTNETLHLSKAYVERFLAVKRVSRSQLQLVGISSMLIAAKFEEIYPPGVDDMVYISDNTYSRMQVIDMESIMLNTLEFDLTSPTPLYFLQRYLRVAGSDRTFQMLANYLIELTIQSYSMAEFLPSQIAMAATILCNKTFKIPLIHPDLSRFVQDRNAVAKCVAAIYKLWVGASKSKVQAVRTKYERSRYGRVSRIKPPRAPPVL